MAKLSAYGRRVVVEATKTDSDGTRIQYREMSDGTVLRKITIFTEPTQYDPKPKPNSAGWKVTNLRIGLTVASLASHGFRIKRKP